MKTVIFSNDQLAAVRSALGTRINKLEVMINFRLELSENHPELMTLRDELDVTRQALEQVEA